MMTRIFIAAALAAFLSSIVLARTLSPNEIAWDSMFHGPGQISLRVDPAVFSPNNDGKQDSAFFFLGTQGVPDLSKWAIYVENSRGRDVRRFTGQGSPPGLTEWNGLNNKNSPLPEGVYTAKAIVWGRSGKTMSPNINITLDNTPPKLGVILSTASFSPDEPSGSTTVTLRADDNAALGPWALSITVKDHPDVEVFSASGVFTGGLAAQTWDGKNARNGRAVPHGIYSVRATVQDAAGNETAAPAVDVEVVVKPESILKQLSKSLEVEPTADGLQMTVPSTRLFNNKYSDDLSDESAALRQQLLYLVQSFPNHAVYLEGHVGSEKTAQERTDLSSAQAWSLYSYLVKSGVTATRLIVQGMGGKPGENNRIVVRFQAAAQRPEQKKVSAPAGQVPTASTSTMKTDPMKVSESSSPISSNKTGANP